MNIREIENLRTFAIQNKGSQKNVGAFAAQFVSGLHKLVLKANHERLKLDDIALKGEVARRDRFSHSIVFKKFDRGLDFSRSFIEGALRNQHFGNPRIGSESLDNFSQNPVFFQAMQQPPKADP